MSRSRRASTNDVDQARATSRRAGPARRLSNKEIDAHFARAAGTIREVREQLASCFVLPASVRGLALQARRRDEQLDTTTSISSRVPRGAT